MSVGGAEASFCDVEVLVFEVEMSLCLIVCLRQSKKVAESLTQ